MALEKAAGTLVIELGYRGAAFAGYAEQPGQRTVQGELRRALETVLRRPVEMECAGRTDAGVNALAQYVSVPVAQEELALSGERLVRSLVALTSDDLSIRALYRAKPGFSARFDARSRRYVYRICPGQARPILGWDHAWWLRSVRTLDMAAMREAAACLVGEHDFTSFCKADSAHLLQADGRSLSRNLSRVDVRWREEAGDRLAVVEVEGNAFLHNMVRIIVGSLVEVGRGHLDAAWLADALAARNRSAAGPTAPPQGLTFEQVIYPPDSLQIWE